MGFVRCLDVVSDVIKDINIEHSQEWDINDEKEDALIKSCKKIDKLIDELDASEYNVTVNEDNKSITISILCDEIVVDEEDCNLYNILRCADSISLSNEDNRICADVTFNNIWKTKM